MEKEDNLKDLVEEGTLLPEKEIQTPFGEVGTPPIELPPLKLPPRPDQLSERQKEALGHATGSTLGGIIGYIPIIGDIISDAVEDMHGPELKKLLTPEEKEKFIHYDRTYPTLIALIRTFQETSHQ